MVCLIPSACKAWLGASQPAHGKSIFIARKRCKGDTSPTCFTQSVEAATDHVVSLSPDASSNKVLPLPAALAEHRFAQAGSQSSDEVLSASLAVPTCPDDEQLSLLSSALDISACDWVNNI